MSYLEHKILSDMHPGWVEDGFAPDATDLVNKAPTGPPLDEGVGFMVPDLAGEIPLMQVQDTALDMKGLSLDPIHKDLVGGLKIVKLVHDLVASFDQAPRWVSSLEKIVRDSVDPLWCGFSEEDYIKLHGSKQENRASRFKHTRTCFAPYIEELAACGLLRNLAGEPDRGKAWRRIFVTIFVVIKDARKLRFIANCRPINTLFHKFMKVHFPTMEQLFVIFSYFGPSALYAIADYRHWFYQIPLTGETRRFFNVMCNQKVYEFTALPMGFAGAPFMAQSLSMGIAKLAIERAGLIANHPEEVNDGIPPVWIVTKARHRTRDLRADNILAFVVFWCGNLLVVSGSKSIRESLVGNVASVSKIFHARWKCPGDSPASSFTSGTEGFTYSEGEVQYLGIHFRWESSTHWSWRHLAKNTARWGAARAVIMEKPAESRTWKELAFFTGVLVWDWVLSGEDRRSLKRVLTASHALGKAKLTRPWQWTESAKIGADQWTHLDSLLTGLLNGNLAGRGRKTPFGRSLRKLRERYCASDACDKRAAGVCLLTNAVIMTKLFVGTLRDAHITRKETMAALWTLRSLLGKNVRTRFVIALDNTTAVSALNSGMAFFDKDVDDFLQNTRALFLAADCEWLAVYIPGEDEPADEPSRNEPLNVDKCREAVIHLDRRKIVWHDLIRSGRKRTHEDTLICGSSIACSFWEDLPSAEKELPDAVL